MSKLTDDIRAEAEALAAAPAGNTSGKFVVLPEAVKYVSAAAFAVGDVVCLKSGGPPMTVETAPADKDYCRVVWFNPNHSGPYREDFSRAALTTETG